MSEYERFQHAGCTVVLEYDDDCASPRDACNVGVMLADGHTRYTLGDEQYPGPDYEPTQRALHHFAERGQIRSFPRWLKVFYGSTVVLPLYLLDHSGLAMRTGPFREDPGGWDSGMVGFIFDTPHTREETGCSPEAVEDALKVEVQYYDAYLQNEAIGYRVEDEDGEEVEACWGYLIPDEAAVDYVRREGRDAADRHRATKPMLPGLGG